MQCKDKCIMADYIANSPLVFSIPSNFWQSGSLACLLLDQLPDCTKDQSAKMLVSFTNGPEHQCDWGWSDDLLENCHKKFDVQGVINVDDEAVNDPISHPPHYQHLPVNPHPYAKIHLPHSTERFEASQKIYNCIISACCKKRRTRITARDIRHLYVVRPGSNRVSRDIFNDWHQGQPPDISLGPNFKCSTHNYNT